MSKLTRMLTLALSLGLLAVNPTQGQNNENRGGYQQEMKQRSDALKAKLKLSEEQSVLFDDILKKNREDARNQMMALPEGSTPQDRITIMRASMEKSDLQIFEILDSEQQIVFKAEREKTREEFKDRVGESKKKKRKSEG